MKTEDIVLIGALLVGGIVAYKYVTGRNLGSDVGTSLGEAVAGQATGAVSGFIGQTEKGLSELVSSQVGGVANLVKGTEKGIVEFANSQISGAQKTISDAEQANFEFLKNFVKQNTGQIIYLEKKGAEVISTQEKGGYDFLKSQIKGISQVNTDIGNFVTGIFRPFLGAVATTIPAQVSFMPQPFSYTAKAESSSKSAIFENQLSQLRSGEVKLVSAPTKALSTITASSGLKYVSNLNVTTDSKGKIVGKGNLTLGKK
jgi:hypothetical protein